MLETPNALSTFSYFYIINNLKVIILISNLFGLMSNGKGDPSGDT